MEALRAKRREIAAKIRELNADLTHLDAVIAMFGGAQRPRGKHVARQVLDVLRGGGEMTAASIAEAIGADAKKVGAALAHQRVKGVVRGERRGKCVVWELVGG